MKITLKNIKANLEFSEETIMFKADVYLDNRKFAYAQNDGRGGITYFRPYEMSAFELRKALDCLATKNKDLNTIVNDLVGEYLVRGQGKLPSKLPTF